ncbi:HNH endonuclease signature motif containing protein [Sinomonas sp. B1-1]|uniref:HNH endonuclease signature motif containing protein n=1 Tax=Sinomonas sp. B1-1 TaxID=3141454 RepID=UPI003D2C9522
MKLAERIILKALLDLGADRRWTKCSRRHLQAETSYGLQTIANTVDSLEADGLLNVRRSRVQGVECSFRLTEEGVKKGSTKWGLSEALPDCFRTRDLKGPGRLWQAAAKGVPLTMDDLADASGVRSRVTLRKYIRVLADLPVPAVTTAAESRKHLYVMRELSQDEMDVIYAELDRRSEGYRPTPRAETKARQQRQRDAFYLRLRSYEEAYDDALPAMLEQCTVDARGCWKYSGDLDSGGYALVPGSRLPFGNGHRASYRTIVGEIPAGRQVHHACGTRSCLNPGHLLALTPEQHDFYTKHQSVDTAQLIQYVSYCPEHDERVAHGTPMPPADLVPCVNCAMELVSLIASRDNYDLAA